MAASFQWNQTYGASPGTSTDLGTSGNLFNFKDIDDATAADYNSHPIVASDSANQGRSFEVWLRGHLTGSFNNVDNVQFWRSTNYSPATGLTLYWKGNNVGAYVTPVKTDSTVATASVPSSDPGTANVTIATSLTGALTSAGYTDYIVLQLDVATTATPGDTSQATFTIQYDEY